MAISENERNLRLETIIMKQKEEQRWHAYLQQINKKSTVGFVGDGEIADNTVIPR